MPKKKMTPAQRASARWSDVETKIVDGPDEADSHARIDPDDLKSEPANGDHLIISIVLIAIVVVAGAVFTTMQGGSFF